MYLLKLKKCSTPVVGVDLELFYGGGRVLQLLLEYDKFTKQVKLEHFYFTCQLSWYHNLIFNI